ncbi:MAG: hypothetical protein BEN19_09065 [Epulopiscium sp. Nuni2H_MBin003]|nr:MAG: hypothetical protein BEN19_09065 [Epulopiscium sp. Nuni2H_MBin003]
MSLIHIEEDKCAKCGRCIVFCPMGLLENKPDGFPQPTKEAYQRCVNCGYCVDICIFDALFHKIRKRNANSKDAALKRYETLLKRGVKKNAK